MTGAQLLRSVASALRRPAASTRGLSLRCPPARQLSSAAVAAAPKSSAAAQAAQAAQDAQDADALALLERSIAQRRPAQALDLLAQLQAPAQPQLLQRLALLLARQRKSRGHALRAFEILRGVYRAPGLQPDDYTQLASIYVLDACLRFRLLDQAVELYDEAVNQAVVLDLPAYDGLLTALLDAKRVEEATEILREVLAGDDVCPVERTFLPVLLELVTAREYDVATDMMRQGQTRGVEFTSETFHPLLVLAEKDTASTDSLITFLQFVEDSWEEYKAIDDFDPEEDDVDDPENPFRRM
ncbi:PPR repeat protein [Phytophthora cinnamomi]|uniref:PPR repeat protein n=1 Tax=Phytophthora cinnamomi TaxID=4785 RepID=UPI0035598BE1|nr:PPR repeat protein [Phytophthora cinnamomi]